MQSRRLNFNQIRFYVLDDSVAHVGRESHHGIAGSLADAPDACGSVSVEDGPIFSKRQQSRGIFCGLPVRVVRATLHVIDLLPIEIERHAQFDEGIHVTPSRENAVA